MYESQTGPEKTPSVDYEPLPELNPYEGTMLDPSASVLNYLDLAKKEGVDIGADLDSVINDPTAEVRNDLSDYAIQEEIDKSKERNKLNKARAAEAARLEAQAKAEEERRRRKGQEARDKAARDAVAKTNFGKAKEEAKKNPFADLSKFGGGRAKGGLAKMKTKPTAKRKGGLASKKK